MKKIVANISVDESSKDSKVYLNKDVLTLLQAVSNVEKGYLSYADSNANAADEDIIIQIERVFAYELYHQWSLLKDENLILNGEIGKFYVKDNCYPDLVLHGGQNDPNNNKIVVEIKRECMVKGKPDAILDDLEKLSFFLETLENNKQQIKFRNYENAVFILLKGKLSEISDALKDEKASGKKISDNIICITYNEKKEICISCVGDLKK
jgi:hypothetical protein